MSPAPETAPRLHAGSGPPSVAEASASRALVRRRRRNRWASVFVTGGGLAIILVILGILVFLVAEVLPLFGSASIERPSTVSLGRTPLAVVTDDYRALLVALDEDGVVRVRRPQSGEDLVEHRLLPEGAKAVQAALAAASQELVIALDDGRAVLARLDFDATHEGESRRVDLRTPVPVVLEIDPAKRQLRRVSGRLDEEGAGAVAAQLEDGRVVLVTRTAVENAFTGERVESFERVEAAPVPPLSALILNRERTKIVGATTAGRLYWWAVAGGRLGAPKSYDAGSGVGALTFLIGDQSLVVGGVDGALSVWMLVRGDDDGFELERIRDFPPHRGAVTLLSASSRGKGFVALDATGELGLYHSTSSRTLARITAPLPAATSLFFCPKADGVVLAAAGQAALSSVHNPHPEVGLGAYFGRVHYENYREPRFVWQSSSGSDDYEPKYSLVPLIFGTLKGTLFSLLLAVPTAVLAAMFASQFMHPSLKQIVKPAVEIMASLPSVVLGFVAGLWLAPRVEQFLPGIVLMVPVLPLSVLVAGLLYGRIPGRIRERLKPGVEILPFMVAIAAAAALCLGFSEVVDRTVFGGDYRNWLQDVLGLRFDQKNSIVVALAMGFAVIPIVFTISEEAFSNVPKGLTLGSLALGASRWQTVTRVVLPTASPGIFSAVMVGFGRAVGETMIVLMAAGNTPILEWSPFNGFRTLSANIATEIPEAPHGGTLYRTLFLAALILFILTFVVNTAAEVVRDRLRRRYANL